MITSFQLWAATGVAIAMLIVGASMSFTPLVNILLAVGVWLSGILVIPREPPARDE